jgi:hypothetical protein
MDSLKQVRTSDEDLREDRKFMEDSKRLEKIIDKQRNKKRRQNAAYIKMMLMETGVSFSK